MRRKLRGGAVWHATADSCWGGRGGKKQAGDRSRQMGRARTRAFGGAVSLLAWWCAVWLLVQGARYRGLVLGLVRLGVRTGCGLRQGSLLASQCDRAGRAHYPLRAKKLRQIRSKSGGSEGFGSCRDARRLQFGQSRAARTLASLAGGGMRARVTLPHLLAAERFHAEEQRARTAVAQIGSGWLRS